ncbi:MAG: putative viral replication protein [Cressdnaviricota sp.]|nr:MAG: putative viral replication protein [Cressdnaviricota sp.]
MMEIKLPYVANVDDEVGRVIYTGDFQKQRARNWCFTHNNYTPNDIEIIKTAWPSLDGFMGVMFEEEKGEAKATPHLQGFICFSTMKSGKQMLGTSPKTHWSVMKGSIEQNKTYCSKDGSGIIVIGAFPMSSKDKGIAGAAHGAKGATHGAKAPNIWAAFVNDVKAGTPRKELMVKYAELGIRYPKGFNDYFEEFTPKHTFSILERYGSYLQWQLSLMDIIDLGAGPREVIWIYSPEGNVGKSDMAKHLIYNKGFQPLQNATSRDLSCAWKCGSIVMDLARDQGNVPINYGFLECVKDGRSFSSKYESTCKLADPNSNRFVICFSNEYPDINKLSPDRWAIFLISDRKLIWQDPVLYTGTVDCTSQNEAR